MSIHSVYANDLHRVLWCKVGNLVFHRFLSRAVSAQLRELSRFRLCGTRPRASLRRSALRRASETDYAQKPETQTIPSDCTTSPDYRPQIRKSLINEGKVAMTI